MALWLDLIPKLHKSDDLDSRFHQLENSSDRSSFEEDGTKDSSAFQPEIIESSTSSAAPTGGSGTTTTTTNNVWSTSRRFTGAGAAAVVRSRRTTPPPHAVVLPPSVESPTGAWVEPSPPPGGSGGVDPDHSSASSLLSLRVTVGIGCALLVLNVLIFAGLCYQKDRVRRDMRMNTRFLDHLLRGKTAAAAQDATTAGGHPHDIYSVGPSSSDLNAADAAAAADSNGGNSIPRRISVHHHHHHQPLQSTTTNDDDDYDGGSFPQEATTKTSGLRRNSTLNRRSPPYAMVLSSHCLVPPPPPLPQPTAATNHVDCRDGGGLLLLGYLSAEHGTLSEEHCSSSSNPSTVV